MAYWLILVLKTAAGGRRVAIINCSTGNRAGRRVQRIAVGSLNMLK